MSYNLRDAPETNKLVLDMTYILDKINEDEKILELRKTDYDKYMDYICEIKEFQPFIEKYFTLFMMITSPEPPPFEIIEMLIDYKAQVELKLITQEQADKEIAEFMNEKFIYSKFGGKLNFEKEIIKRQKQYRNQNNQQKRF